MHAYTPTQQKVKTHKSTRLLRNKAIIRIFKTFEPCMKFIVSKLIYILCFVTHEEDSVLYDICALIIYGEMHDAIKIIFSRTGKTNIITTFFICR